METKEMSFPEYEYTPVMERLDSGKICYTTRVYKELGKYEVNGIYNTPFGRKIRVEDIKIFNKISDHPFYDELTADQRDELFQYSEAIKKPIELIAFTVKL